MNRERLERILGNNESDLLVRLVHHADKEILKSQQAALAELNVSQTQALFIIYLGYYADKVNYQYMLESSFGLTNPTVTASLKSLVAKNIIYRQQDEKDGRYYQLHLTEYGKTLVDPCADAFLESNEELTKKLTAEEIHQLVELLGKLVG